MGKQVNAPVSLRDLPATVVDLLGLGAGSPFQGHSLAAYWNLPPSAGRISAEISTPAFTEQADPSALTGITPPGDLGHGGFQMSVVTRDHHYMRDGLGKEQLFSLNSDPVEKTNLLRTDDGSKLLAGFRRTLLDFLRANPASAEVENAYLKRYKEQLAALLQRPAAPVTTTSATTHAK